MRLRTFTGLFTLMLMLTPGLVFADHVIDDSKEIGYMLVLSAASGSLNGETLTLNGVPNVVYFSDRPARIAGHLSTDKFLDTWNSVSGSFNADPPNATLSVMNKNGSQNAIIELMSLEKKNGKLQFKVRMLQGTIPETFKASSLFIDTGNDLAQQL